MRREVVYVQLANKNTFIPGMGGLESSLPPKNKTYRDLKMFYTDTCIEISFNGRSFGIPHANVFTVEFAPEAKEPASAPKSVAA